MAHNSGRALLVVAVVALGAVAAMILGLRQAYSAYSLTQPHQLTVRQLRAGDCITGSGLSPGTGSLPNTVTAVACNHEHLAEIIFAGNLWPASLAAYPGALAVRNTVDYRCLSALMAYAGRSNPSLTYDSIAPTGVSDWASGDREVLCMAYEPATYLFHSVKATR